MSIAEEKREGFYRSEDGEWVPEGWAAKSLSELTSKIGSGATPRGGKDAYKNEGITLIRSQNILDLKFEPKGLAFIDEDQANQLSNVEIQEEDVLINITGDSVARVCRVPSTYLPARVNQHVAIIRADRGESDPRFLEYLLVSRTNKGDLLGLASAGATRNALTKGMLENFRRSVPSPSEQKAIAAVLGCLDDKIELLREQNETLEALAQTLFKHWFIDFNFPDEKGNPYKDSGGKMIASELGEIPEGWIETELGQLVTVKRGGSPRPIKDFITEGEGLRWLKISDASATKSPYIHTIAEKIIVEGLRNTTHLDSGKLVLSNSATPGIPKFLAVDSCIHDGWLHFPNIGYLSQEYLYLLFLKIRPELLMQGNGSVFTNLKTDILKEHVIVVPNKGHIHEVLIHGFSHFFEKIKINAEQIQTLTKLRNTLLPKLMKGEIRVPVES